MKKITCVTLILAFATSFVACNKDTRITEKQKPAISSLSKSNLDFAVDDIIGAGAGMSWGSLGGPFGSFCGGVALGVYMSVRDIRVVPANPTNPTEDVGGESYVIASANPYEFIGNIHNKAMQHIFENTSTFYLSDETFNTNAYNSWAPNFYGSFSELDGYDLSVATFNGYVTDLAAFYTGDFNAGLAQLYAAGDISLDVKNSLDNYWTTLTTYTDNEDRKTYYISYVDAINNSTTFTSQESTILLGTASLGIYSVLYHTTNLP